jgi:hypothetical protein
MDPAAPLFPPDQDAPPSAPISVRADGQAGLDELRSLLYPYLETYFGVLHALGTIRQGPMTRKQLEAFVPDAVAGMYMTEEIKRKEATSRITIKHALERYRDLKILRESPKQEGSDRTIAPIAELDVAKWQTTLDQMRLFLDDPC